MADLWSYRHTIGQLVKVPNNASADIASSAPGAVAARSASARAAAVNKTTTVRYLKRPQRISHPKPSPSLNSVSCRRPKTTRCSVSHRPCDLRRRLIADFGLQASDEVALSTLERESVYRRSTHHEGIASRVGRSENIQDSYTTTQGSRLYPARTTPKIIYNVSSVQTQVPVCTHQLTFSEQNKVD